jgi:hypothetical protein
VTRRDVVGWAWVAGALGLILLATLTPQTGSPRLGQDFFAVPTTRLASASRDWFQNVLLYVPLGLVFVLRGRRWQRAILTSALLSLATELCQYAIPGRDPSAIDVLTNVAGANIGWAFTAWARIRSSALTGLLTVEQWLADAVRPTRRAATWLSLAWATVMSVAVASTFWLLSPVLPEPFYFVVSTPFIDEAREPLRIGGDGDPPGFFTGLIDEVRIYSIARTAESIRADMGRPIAGSSSEPGLVAAYGFDSSEGEVSDATGRTPAGALHGAKWTPTGRFGGALFFNGSTDVEMPESPAFALRRAVTIEAWVNPARRQTGHGSVVTKGGGAYFILTVDPETLLPSAGGQFGRMIRSVYHRSRLPPDEWTHLAMTYDGQWITLFVNGRPSARLRHWSTHYPLAMSLNDLDLPPGFVSSPPQFRSMLSGQFVLRIAVTCGPLQNESAPVFTVFGVQSQEVLAIDASGPDLFLRPLQRALRVGLTPVEYRVPDVLAGCLPGHTRSFAVRGPMQDLQVEDANGRPMERTRPGVGSGWAFLLDAGVMPAPLVATVSIAYLALLVLPFGFWARVALPSTMGAVLFAGTLWGVPKVWGTAAVSGLEGAGMVAGALLGVLLSRASAHEHGLDGLEHHEDVERQ